MSRQPARNAMKSRINLLRYTFGKSRKNRFRYASLSPIRHVVVGADENLPLGVSGRNLTSRAAPEELVELVARQIEEVVVRERHGHPFLM